ncbi:DUF4340 domain-containing protein [Dokdonella immobilis]|uniref:DUF4340 domain-containing protein n=1 Tax=Dokdonella immobilis TaxID=578942 RepID=A0A1I4XKX9_9GAMM|nr:DUF4340 domain-containing protein [Dokdonella immobilis]SFN25919.1 protein of unknown function [Dokdonella immobilis]
MNQRTLIKLGVVTVVAVIAAFAINHSRQPVSEFSDRATSLVDGLGEHVNDVNGLTLSEAGGRKTVELTRSDKGWTVKDKGGYPADTGKLRGYLLKVADASLIERKTANKERYPDIGVADISESTAKGIQVEIAGLAAPVSFIAGTFNAQGGGTYVRRSGEAQSWLAKGNLIPDRNASDWLRKDLANIPSERIASVTITHADGRPLRVFKNAPEDPHYTIADLPKGREASSDFAANGLASVLADLRIDDVAPTTEVAVPDNAKLIRYQTFDGLVVDAHEWQVGDKHYASFAASLDEDVAGKHIAAEQEKASAAAAAVEQKAAATDTGKTEGSDAKAEGASQPASPVDPEKDRADRMATLRTEVDALNAAFQGWSFVVPAYKSANMTKTMDDLLKPLEAKAGSGPAKTAGSSKK